MRRWGILGIVAAVAAVVMLALPVLGSAAPGRITLQRDPTPPTAVQPGQTVNITWSIVYESVAKTVQLSIRDQAQVPLFTQTYPYDFIGPGDGSPLPGAYAYTVPPGLPDGRYTARIDFFSSLGDTAESFAGAVFDVSREVGTLTLVKYEDVNGNGVREPGEPGVPNWVFNTENPQHNTDAVRVGADGTATFPRVPAGPWTIGEPVQTDPVLGQWLFVTPPGGVGTVRVPNGGSATFTAGNALPAEVSGIVFVDANGNGVRDAGEQVRADVLITLTGSTPLGLLIGGSTVTDANGAYVFGGLLPGTYATTVTVPAGFRATTPTTLPGIGVTSRAKSPDHNFGIQPGPAQQQTPPGGAGPATTAGRPAPAKPGLALTKAGPSRAEPGETVNYTIRVTNPGQAAARNVVVTDPLPPRMTFVSSKPSSTLKNGVVTWSVGTLAPKASRTLGLTLRLDPTAPAGRYTNTATARATSIGPRRASTTLTVGGPGRAPRTGGVTG